MENQIIAVLFPQVAKSTFGQKMFKRIAPLVEGLCDANSTTNLAAIVQHLQYHPGASAPQQMVFNFLADVALAGDWRQFVAIYGELMFPGNALSVLGEPGRKEFFEVY